ncbi:protein FAM184B isoform X2 [Phycodurus eques]|uniref:protein FAM184B isoform X2 n=1 Tax=Phycodurus eques TaxID=693459 RepID=UPI002ACDF9B3|nr:protein FAM184B isoform X2 [Phycodurus eques]
MASGPGKAIQSPGPGSAVNGNAADFQTVEQEQCDFQMHNKMCKKIAQLTKVIYSLNMKNEEQEAALQASNHARDEELHRILMETCQEEEGSVLRTRLLQPRESLDEQQRVGAQVRADFKFFRMQSEERERETEAELRRDFEERLRAAEEELREAESRIGAAREENLRLGKELEEAEETIRDLSDRREPRRTVSEDEEEETEQKGPDEESERVKGLLEEVNATKEERDQREEERRRAADAERERWEQTTARLREEKEEMRKKMEAERQEERRRWEEREEEEKKGMHSALRERAKRAEAEVENHLERQAERKRNTVKLQERIQNLEEELELDRKRVSEAEGSAQRAEEELAVAKERLLLQEDELQSRAELLNAGCKACVCADAEDLKSQLSRLQSRNRELELQSGGRNNDHARQIRQHAEALSGLRSEMVRAQTEELRRIQKHADEERDKLQTELDKERETVQREREQEKSHLEKERNRLRRERDEEKEALRQEADGIREHVRREMEEEAERLRKELDVERVRVRARSDKNFEQAEAQRAALQRKLEEEKRRLAEKAEEDRRRLKEQVRKAIEEVMRRHAAELHGVREALNSEKMTNREVCAHLEEERRKNGALHDRLERERQELEMKLKDADNEIFRLKAAAAQRQEEKDKAAPETSPPCGPQCSRLREDLQQTRSRLTRMRDEAEKQRQRQERDIASLRADKHRLEEKVLEHSRLNTERNLLEQSRRDTDERVRAECEDRLRAEFRIEMNAAVAGSEQRWRNRERELHARMAELQKEETEDDSHGDLEIDKLRKEVEETKEINKKLRELLQEPRSSAEERRSHAVQLQALERQAKEDVLSERNRLQTTQQLELDKQRAELTQQHTEWSRQMTQRHMQQIEDLRSQLRAHTQMTALQQDLKQQNQNQVFERQLDESRCAALELQRENAALKKQLQEKSMQANPKMEAKEGAGPDLQKTRDAHLEDEALRLKEEVEKLRVEMEKLEESHKLWEEKKEDDDEEEEEGEREKKKKPEEEERRTKELEEVRKEHKREIQNLLSEYGGAQMQLQARIVALENELREREERCRRREPRCDDDPRLGKLQERLTEREQLIKRLVEERHQLQLHSPAVAPDNGGLRIRENKPRPGSATPTMRRKPAEASPGASAISRPGAQDRLPPYSSTLPHRSSPQPHASPRYSSSSLPHKHTSPSPSPSPSLGRRSPPSLPRSPRSRTSCVPPTPAPTGPLPVCPSQQTGIRYVSPSCQEPHAYLQAQSIRGPCMEQRGTEGLKQEWFTKYFSF